LTPFLQSKSEDNYLLMGVDDSLHDSPPLTQDFEDDMVLLLCSWWCSR